MPNHQFKCLDCGHTFEALLPAGKTEGMKCLECGHPETQKLLSAPGVHFKGSGFYKTDSKVGGNGEGGNVEKKTDAN